MSENTQWWFSKHSSGMYRKHLQIPESVSKIWLLYSHDKMNTGQIVEAIKKTSGEKLGYNIPMALVFSVIKDEKNGTTKTRV